MIDLEWWLTLLVFALVPICLLLAYVAGRR
jgi:hypothetical protein